ncbi:MAG: Nif3-like dinuclear metal center hexameric protein [Pseudomonadota bacterium]
MNTSHPSVAEITALMEDWAPAWTAESWDRVGLATGDPAAPVARAWVALELTDRLLDAALAGGVDMLLLHHPPLFKPLTDLCSHRPATARLLKAAARGLAIFAAHTNLDAAPGGVNDALAARLGLADTRPLAPLASGGLAKLVTFVPRITTRRSPRPCSPPGRARSACTATAPSWPAAPAPSWPRRRPAPTWAGPGSASR